jgi:hypothetical protein
VVGEAGLTKKEPESEAAMPQASRRLSLAVTLQQIDALVQALTNNR